MTTTVMPGAEAWSHRPDRPGDADPGVGVLVLHGFTGNPSSVRGLAEAFAAAGYHVESPRLPGHGTTIDEMLHTSWNDWVGEVHRAVTELASRVDAFVLAGLSMGGSLALWTAINQGHVGAEPAGVVCVNPATQPQPPEVIEMLHEMLDDGMEVMPGIGADIADPDAVDLAYEGTPVRPLLSLIADGLTPMRSRYGEITVPLRLFTSRQDHVVAPADSEHLAATFGGPVEHTWLERSYHVATQDFDRDLVFDGAVEFVGRVAGA
ncbi:MAG: alpha/beta fold hydrolase [Ilumatobacteraceae bacterium]